VRRRRCPFGRGRVRQRGHAIGSPAGAGAGSRVGVGAELGQLLVNELSGGVDAPHYGPRGVKSCKGTLCAFTITSPAGHYGELTTLARTGLCTGYTTCLRPARFNLEIRSTFGVGSQWEGRASRIGKSV